MAIIYTIITHPVLLLTRSFFTSSYAVSSFHSRLSSYLLALLRLQLHALDAPIPLTLSSRSYTHFDPTEELTIPRAVWIHLLNPCIAIALAGAGWVVLLFWATSAIVADEKESEQAYPHEKRRDGDGGGDGKRTASSVVGVWERFEGTGALWGRANQ